MDLLRPTNAAATANPPPWLTIASTSRFILTTTALTSVALLLGLSQNILASPFPFRASGTYIPSPPKTWSSLRRKKPSKSTTKPTPSPASAAPAPADGDDDGSSHPYPPENALPGARDIASPYGSIRAYEWGPEQGEKVLLVHGISTPGIALGDLAHELVGRGFRVMVFDLFGRGYSDAPCDLPYDARLYTTQILLVLCSSPIPGWTTKGFHLVGYSLGGCLCAAFAAHLPQLLLSLNLIATAGLIRRNAHVGWSSWWLYDSGLLPERLVRWVVWRRIRPGGGGDPEKNRDVDSREQQRNGENEGTAPGERGVAANPADLSAAEIHARDDQSLSSAPSPPPPSSLPSVAEHPQPKAKNINQKNSDATGGPKFDSSSISRHRPGISISSVVRWQMDAHREGFLTAFLSTIRRAPIYAPQEQTVWGPLRGHLARKRMAREVQSVKEKGDGDKGEEEEGSMGLTRGKVLFVLGEEDPVIDAEETVADAKEALGEEGVEFEIVKGAGHELVITESLVVADALVRFWRC